MIALGDACGINVAAGVAVGDNVAVIVAEGAALSTFSVTTSLVVGASFVWTAVRLSSCCFCAIRNHNSAPSSAVITNAIETRIVFALIRRLLFGVEIKSGVKLVDI